MNIRIALEGDAEVRRHFRKTPVRIWVDEAEITNRCTRIVLDLRAGDIPEVRIELLKHRDGAPYSNERRTDAAREVIEFVDGRAQTTDVE
jgi:hypothetical protein